MPEFSIPEFETAFQFRQVPITLPADLRPHWLIAIIAMILLKCSRASKASLQKLHVLSWAVRDRKRLELLLGFLDGEFGPEDVLVRYEPGLDRALRFARAEDLVQVVGGKQFQLTAKGAKMAREIDGATDCLVDERRFFDQLGMRATESRLTALLHMENLL